MTAPAAVGELVERFREHRDAYLSDQYNETQLRRDFLDPLFKALGWDVDNEQGYAQAYREVIHEDAIKIGGHTKAPDYCFRVGGGVRSFFVEAKRPSVDIRNAPEPAYQLRRYAWSAKLPVSILTDFEELSVYDTRVRPGKNDKPSTARILYFRYDEYVERWPELAGLFSPEAIRRGALDKFISAKKVKRGTAEVDKAFLEEIEGWRDLLARNLALRNADLSQRDLNFAVQRTIDRIVFLRICEDRGIEAYGQLHALLNSDKVYPRLGQLFHKADQRYNSGLFYFTAERGRPDPPDELTLGLTIDDKVLKEIIRRLYYPDSPYEFSVLPAEILGQVYEQFLGKVIRLTRGHQARVEEKPEVRKAGGVYYTPAYIVDYIVRKTIGKRLDEGGLKGQPMTPKQAQRLCVVDPACGSGSFLIGAYQFLLDWHRDWYTADGPEKHARGRQPKLFRGRSGEWRLTTSEKKRILLNNIYGVDIDPQAVEVTKLSLLLKVLENENEESLANQLRLFHERALPDLGRNIKCGNSLIGPDFYEDRQMSLLDEEEIYRINAFDWQAEFPEVFKGRNAGFDVVIGNPPYISIQTMSEFNLATVQYYNGVYEAAGRGNYDIYVVFIEKGLSLLSKSGVLGFILPSKFFATDYGQGIRKIIASNRALSHLVDFRHEQVFPGATTYTCLLFLSSQPTSHAEYWLALPPESIADTAPTTYTVDTSTLSEKPWTFLPNGYRAILEKARENSVPLLELPTRISRGSSTGDDEVFVLAQTADGYCTRDGVPVDIEPEILRTPIYATDFGRYRFAPQSADAVIFPYVVTATGYREMREDEFAGAYPKAYSYLKSNRSRLLKRKQYKSWFSFSAPRNLNVHAHADLMVPLLARTGSYCLLPDSMAKYCPMASGGFTISVSAECDLSPKYVLGVLNSTLLYWMLERISNVFRGGWITCTKQYVGTLPMRGLDLSDRSDKKRHERMVGLVERMLSLEERLPEVRTAHAKAVLQRQIAATDRQIDALVYELYGLTEDEIRLVEEATSGPG